MSSSTSSSVIAVSLPTGGKLLASATLKTGSSECSGAANLATQIAPLLAWLSPQLLILKLLKPLIDIVHSLPNPSVTALQEFSKAATDLAPLLLAPTQGSLLPFVRDLICLEIRSLNCLQRSLQAAATQAAAGHAAVAADEIQSVLDSYEPVVGILELAAGMIQSAGFNIPRAPTLAAGKDPAALNADQKAVAAFVTELQSAADAIGGCLG
ncbi:MAG TPA: hypothetical protein VG096_23205 [Bryobacteraceae bacterium]|jgi:hypothetical protein|nr:hypothetical protein [Bryobacteraceae bacterium]